MTKNIQISFRLSQYQLAHCLEILKGLEPSYKPSSLTAMVKLIVQDWIGKLSAATKPWPSLESQEEIVRIMMQTAQGKRITIQNNSNQELAHIAAEMKTSGTTKMKTSGTAVPAFMNETMVEVRARQNREAKEARQKEARQKEIQELETESIKTTVTDFSPPSMEELMNLEEDEE